MRLAVEDTTTLSYEHAVVAELGDLGAMRAVPSAASWCIRCCCWMARADARLV